MAVLPVGIGPVTGYNIERSLRFNSADSAYLNRTPGSSSNLKTWTWSSWVKRSALDASTYYEVFAAGASSVTAIYFYNNIFYFQITDSSGNVIGNVTSAAVFRDPSAWYHIVAVLDTTQATGSNRIKLYVNNVEQTLTFTITPSQNSEARINSSSHVHYVGGRSPYNFNGYMADVHFIDGSALTPSSFGENDTDTGVWKPKAYTGSYGTNGFKLTFSDNSGTTSTTLGKDTSGNGNNWTPNNFSVTAGAGNDSLVDTPTPYGTDTGAGGEVRGNYATLNPLRVTSGVNLTNGNLAFANTASDDKSSFSTIAVTSGKWYAEVKYSAIPVGNVMVGVVYDDGELNAVSYPANRANGYAYDNSGVKYNNGTSASYGATWTTTNTIGIALDLDAATITFYKDGVSQGTAYSSLPSGKTWFFVFGSFGNTSGGDVNFGQRAFAYTAPSGFKALCTTNLPTPAIGATSTTRADDYFDAQLYTGNNGNSLTVTGFNFQPDLVWTKDRTLGGTNHLLSDAVRGTNKSLFSNSTLQEYTDRGVDSFNSNGFTYSNSEGSDGNYLTDSYVAWCWKANGAGSSNTAGSITSTVSANTTAGFSIVTATKSAGASVAQTFGHGLGVAPAMIILKRRDGAEAWYVYHQSLGNNSRVQLNETTAVTSPTGVWDATSPTSTVFTVKSFVDGDFVAYCFAEVAGYSRFGSYTGNGSTDGPFCFCGFKPKYILIKRTNDVADWAVWDGTRDTYNPFDTILYPNTSGAEATNAAYNIDALSNGFKIRNTATSFNGNASTFIFAAFAEVPTKFALAS